MTISSAMKIALASCPPGVAILQTVEMYHPTWGAPVRLVQDRQDIIAALEANAPNNPGASVLFTAFPFTLQYPAIGEGRQELTIVIDNATRMMMSAIESLDLAGSIPIKVIYRPYLSNDLATPQMNPPLRLAVRGFLVNANTVRISCGYADFANLRFPRKRYNANEWPGIVPRT